MVVWVQAGQVLVLEFPDLVSAQIKTEYNRPGMLTVRQANSDPKGNLGWDWLSSICISGQPCRPASST